MALTRMKALGANRRFLSLLSAETVSMLGDSLFDLAISWVIYAHTHSFLLSALALVAEYLAPTFASLVGGIVVNTLNERNTLVIVNLLGFISVSAVASVVISGDGLPIYVYYALIFVISGLASILQTARFSILPQIVLGEELTTSLGFLSSFKNAASVAGNAAAGFLLALVGIGGVLATDALTFTLAASVIFIGIRHWVRPAPVSTDNASRLTFLATLRSGLAVVFQRPAIRTFVGIGIMVNMGMFTTALWPGLVESRLHGTATDLGWIMVAGVVGSIAGGLIVGSLEGRFGVGYVASAGLLVYGAATGFIAIVPWLTLVTALSFVSRVGLQIVSSSSTALFQASVPTEHRATVGGFLNAMGLIGLPVSLTIAGYLSNRFGPGDLFVASGLWFAVMAAIVFRTRSLRQRVADMAHLA